MATNYYERALQAFYVCEISLTKIQLSIETRPWAAGDVNHFYKVYRTYIQPGSSGFQCTLNHCAQSSGCAV